MAPSLAAADELTARPEHSTDGVFQLRWVADGEIVLEEAGSPGFDDARPVYRGTDQATVLTGRPDGTYYYRLREDAGASPGVVTVTVAHHSLGRALGFFAVGGFVFLATVALVLRGPKGDPDDG